LRNYTYPINYLMFISRGLLASTKGYSATLRDSPLHERNFGLYQLSAVKSIQKAVSEGKNRFLFEMATGTGKTLVAFAVIKLYLRTKNARRVLFIVDRLELESQAQKAFNLYRASINAIFV